MIIVMYLLSNTLDSLLLPIPQIFILDGHVILRIKRD